MQKKMADLIADRLSGKLSISSIQIIDQNKEDVPTEEDAFDAALSFLDSF